HLAHDAWRRTWVDLGDCESLEAALQVLRDRVATARHGAWIVGRGWDESTWPLKRYLNRHDLDRVSVSHPILVNRVDGHMCSVNSAVLARVDFGGNGAGVERGADGSPTGVLKEGPADLARAAIPVPTEEERTKLLQAAIRYAHSLGITSVHDFVEPAE